MTAIHRITDDFYEDSFQLIALHSSLEDYALVYRLNLHLKSNFIRTPRDFWTAEQVSFPIFEWKDKVRDIDWILIRNYSSKEEQTKTNTLFGDEPSFITYHFIPEQKEVDYFLKIEDGGMELEENVVQVLNAIPRIVTAYAIEANKLKSKKNLIF